MIVGGEMGMFVKVIKSEHNSSHPIGTIGEICGFSQFTKLPYMVKANGEINGYVADELEFIKDENDCVPFVSNEFISKVEQVKREIAEMSKAKEVLKQIEDVWTGGINLFDLQSCLLKDKITSVVDSVHKDKCWTCSCDNTLMVFFYDDDSALIVNSNGGIRAVG